MICMMCGNVIVQSRYGWQASTLCIVCLEAWQGEERPNKSKEIHELMPLSLKQRELRKAYGTPAEFALACYAAVPGDASMDEAATALQRYQREWDAAGITTGVK